MRTKDKAFIGFVLFILFLEPFIFLEGQQNPIQIDANGLTQTLTAGGVVTRGQIVKINSAGQVVPVLTTDTSGAIGIAATSQTSAGNGVAVSIQGTPLVQIDASGCSAGNIVSFSTTTGGAGHCAATASGQQVGVAISISSPGSNFWNVALSLGGGGGSPATFTKVIYAADTQYAGGVKADGRYIFDATWNNGSGAVTCTNNDCNFTVADNNKACEGVNLATGTATLPVGTFTFTSAQAGSCSVVATGSVVANGGFVVCTDDTIAWQSVTTALYASATPGAVVGPNGSSCVTKGQLLDKRASPIPWQPLFSSEGMTQFIPLATFDFTTCNGASGAGGCFWDVNMAGASQNILPQYNQVVNMGVQGMGFNACGVNANGKSAVVEHRTQGSGIWVWNWCGGAGLNAHSFISPNALTNLQANNSGGFVVTGGSSNAMTYLNNSYCGTSITNSTCVTVAAGANFISKGDFWLGCTNACVLVQSGGTMQMDGDQLFGTSGTQYVDVAGTMYIFGNTQMITTSTPNGLILTRSGGKVFIRDSVVQNTGGGGIAFNINTVTGGSIINQGNVSITGTDQTALVAANVVPSAGWGTTASVGTLSGTPLSNPVRFQFTVTSSGTGQAANPTLAITYPGTGGTFTQPYLTCKQTGGTGTNTSITGEGTATTTSMTLTFNGTPVAASTYQITCQGALL